MFLCVSECKRHRRQCLPTTSGNGQTEDPFRFLRTLLAGQSNLLRTRLTSRGSDACLWQCCSLDFCSSNSIYEARVSDPVHSSGPWVALLGFSFWKNRSVSRNRRRALEKDHPRPKIEESLGVLCLGSPAGVNVSGGVTESTSAPPRSAFIQLLFVPDAVAFHQDHSCPKAQRDDLRWQTRQSAFNPPSLAWWAA